MEDNKPILVVRIAWSNNGWTGFDRKGFEDRERFSFKNVKKQGFASEWWNFYEGFDDSYYYGYAPFIGNNKPSARRINKECLILFISYDIYRRKFYFIGFYNNAEYNRDGLNNNIIKIEYNNKELRSINRISFFKAPKSTSTVFHKDAYVEVEPEDIGVQVLGGQWIFHYIKDSIEEVDFFSDQEEFKSDHIQRNDEIDLVVDLLKKAKINHEQLLMQLDDNQKEKVSKIINKIDMVIEELEKSESSNTIPSQDFQENISLNSYFKSKGYLFPDHIIAQFYLALKSKGFIILAGLTGSGKTKLALEFANLLNKDKYIFLSVKSDWRDSKPLLGYYNPLTAKYQDTQLLRLILEAANDYDKNKENADLYFIILDEMNLAHVEHYFADFLSVLESGRDENGYTRESIKLHINGKDIPKEIKLPPNLYIIGTVNIDETTYMFSPKVLDRAFVIEFTDIMLDQYPPESKGYDKYDELKRLVIDDLRRNGKFLSYSKEEINDAVNILKSSRYWNKLIELNSRLSRYDLHFGYRVIDEIALFYKNAKENSIVSLKEDEAIDLAMLMKILPKFHGNRAKIEEPLKEIINIIDDINIDGKNIDEMRNMLNGVKYLTTKKAIKMLIRLHEQGFTSFF